MKIPSKLKISTMHTSPAGELFAFVIADGSKIIGLNATGESRFPEQIFIEISAPGRSPNARKMTTERSVISFGDQYEIAFDEASAEFSIDRQTSAGDLVIVRDELCLAVDLDDAIGHGRGFYGWKRRVLTGLHIDDGFAVIKDWKLYLLDDEGERAGETPIIDHTAPRTVSMAIIG